MIVERASATKRLFWHQDVIASIFKDLHGCDGGLRMEVIVECIGPQDHLRAAHIARLALAEPVFEGPRREGGHRALWSDTDHSLGNVTEYRRMREEVRESGHARGEPGPPVDQSYRVGDHGAQTARVVVREKLGFIGRHIDIDGAIALTALAGQAQVQRLLDMLVAPVILEYLALQQFEEHAGTTTGGMFLFAES